MSDDYNDGQMIFGDLGGLKLPDICLTGEEKPRKTSSRKPVPSGDRTQARCVTGAHAAARPTAVDPLVLNGFIVDRTSQSAGAGIRASIFNRCNDATVRIRADPLVHASCDSLLYRVHAVV